MSSPGDILFFYRLLLSKALLTLEGSVSSQIISTFSLFSHVQRAASGIRFVVDPLSNLPCESSTMGNVELAMSKDTA